MKKEEEMIGSKTASEMYSFAAPSEFKEQPQLLETLVKTEAADEMEVDSSNGGKKESVSVEIVQNVPDYFYMNEPLENKGRWLESLMERAKSDDIPFSNEEMESSDEDVLTRSTMFNLPVQNDIFAFGRICYEEPEEDGIPPKMTPVNTLLQGPLSLGSPRVKIILSK